MARRWKRIEKNIELDEVSGRYRVRLANGRKPDGGQRTVVRAFGGIEEARAFRDAARTEMGRNPEPRPAMTLDEYFERRYIVAYRGKRGMRQSQADWVRERYRNQISPARSEPHDAPFGQRPVEDPPSIEMVQSAICDDPRWAPRTARAAVSIYRSIYDYLYDDRVVDRKPWGDHRFSYGTAAARPEGADRRDAYTPAEAVEACRRLEEAGSPLAALAAALFGAGLRVSEGNALDRSDIRFAELEGTGLVARAHIHKSSSKRTEGDLIAKYATQVPGVRKGDPPAEVRRKVRAWAAAEGIDLLVWPEPKNSTSERWVTICQPFSGMLLRATACLAPSDPICRNPDGTRRSPQGLPRAWRREFAAGGALEGARFSQLRLSRHAQETMLRKARVPYSELQMYRGHASEMGVDAVNYFDPTDPEMFDHVAAKVFAYLDAAGLV